MLPRAAMSISSLNRTVPASERESKPPATYEDLLDSLYFQNTTADTAQRNFTVTYTDTFGADATSAVLRINAPDTTPPAFQGAATSTDGTKVILTYDEALSATTAATTDFVVNVGGSPVTVKSVVVNGLTVELTLQLPVTSAQAVTVAYTDPNTGSNDTNAVQDAAGNDAASFTATSVTNSVQSGGTSRPYID